MSFSTLSATLSVAAPTTAPPRVPPSPRRPTALPDLDAMSMGTYVDAAMARLVRALDCRDGLTADVEQLALLSVVEGDFFGRRCPRPPRDALLLVAARFWTGLSALAGSGRAASLMPPEVAAHWTAGPAAWPSTPSSLARFLSDLPAAPVCARSGPAGAATGAVSATPSMRAAPAEVQRVDDLLGWLAADLEARLPRVAHAPVARCAAYAPAAAHVLWRAHDAALGRTLYVLADDATLTPRASSCVPWSATPSCAEVATAVPGVAPHSPWSGAPLAMAFSGLTGTGGPGASRVAFIDLGANLRRAITTMGAAGLPMRVVHVPAGSMHRAIARGRAVWTALDLRAIADGCRRRYAPDDRRAPMAAAVSAADVITETAAVATDDDAACDAAGRPGPRAGCVLTRPFWEAARVFGVEPDAVADLAAIEAVSAVAAAARDAFGRMCP
ncbi:hypothetical protein [Pandoravirus japonicus]|uniref:DUF5848 domain-containing protein n=1 Tax=Pandoravirus japonicus TaxID=2823154 RepID=A0A811BPQ4_9VIRU|nr:hypothetical protein [Pandoravirus japonicus]